MRLSDRDIRRYLDEGKLEINPLLDENIQPASVDLKLGNQFYIAKKISSATFIDALNPRLDEYVTYYHTPEIVIEPGQFILTTTKETVVISTDIQGQIDGKSKLARIGLTIHQTGGFIDPGFNGTITLELSNVAPWNIRLYADMLICQISFTELTSEVENPYGSAVLNSHYQGQVGATLPRA